MLLFALVSLISLLTEVSRGCICCMLYLCLCTLMRLIILLVGWTLLQGLQIFVAGPLDVEARLSFFVENLIICVTMRIISI